MTFKSTKLEQNQQGIAHLLIIVVALVLLVVGGASYFVFTKNKSDTSTKKQSVNSAKYEDQRVDDSVLKDLKGTEFDE